MKQAIIKPLHGIRGGAAATVVIGHNGIVKGSPSLGVVLFFVLSGFLIGKLYLERPFKAAEVWTYLVARFARIYPLFAFVVIVVGLARRYPFVRHLVHRRAYQPGEARSVYRGDTPCRHH